MINFLSPEIRREPWTPQEDLLLLETHQRIGNQWAQIAKDICGRTENQVKNRFNSMLKRIREEKTFRENMKQDIQEALSNMKECNEELFLSKEKRMKLKTMQSLQPPKTLRRSEGSEQKKTP